MNQWYLFRKGNRAYRDIEKMMENKKSPCFLDQGSITSLATKRHKAGSRVKDQKEKFGERIVLLQQLVLPYGKTDTASVLLEAMGYIRFLHEQFKMLSAPYLQATPLTRTQGLDEYSLRSRGLCLVPVSSTAGVASKFQQIFGLQSSPTHHCTDPTRPINSSPCFMVHPSS